VEWVNRRARNPAYGKTIENTLFLQVAQTPIPKHYGKK
jgi:hypothetical protein